VDDHEHVLQGIFEVRDVNAQSLQRAPNEIGMEFMDLRDVERFRGARLARDRHSP
jgi:hypothetical protein